MLTELNLRGRIQQLDRDIAKIYAMKTQLALLNGQQLSFLADPEKQVSIAVEIDRLSAEVSQVYNYLSSYFNTSLRKRDINPTSLGLLSTLKDKARTAKEEINAFSVQLSNFKARLGSGGNVSANKKITVLLSKHFENHYDKSKAFSGSEHILVIIVALIALARQFSTPQD